MTTPPPPTREQSSLEARAGSPQLPLELAGAAARLATFEPGPNAPALAAVTRLARTCSGCVTLWGPAGSGKSHLLSAAVQAIRELRSVARPHDRDEADQGDPAGTPNDSPTRDLLHLEGAAITTLATLIAGPRLDAFALIALDTRVDDWGRPAFEEAVFRACHRARAGELGLLLALPAHPAETGIALADLRSRLLGAECFRLAPVDEVTRRRIVAQRASARGLTLSDEALDYLLARLPRDLHTLCDFIDRLDRASLAEQRRPTLPLLRSLMEASGTEAPATLSDLAPCVLHRLQEIQVESESTELPCGSPSDR